jgi:hypothetical protein
LVTSVAELMKPYYNQQPQLIGPKTWRNAQVPWIAPRRAKSRRRMRH